MKRAYKLTLDEWEEQLNRSPIVFSRSQGDLVISKVNGVYTYRQWYPGDNWLQTDGRTLLEMFLAVLLESGDTIDNVVNADDRHVAMLPGSRED